MVTCQASMVLVALLMAALIGGCATQSATNHPSTTAGIDGSSMMEARQADGAGAASAMSARPRLGEFVAREELRDIHFDFDSYQIRPADAPTLDASLQWLKTHPDSVVVIEGHADERGTGEYNVALGERRARASMTYLVSRGIQASRITVLSYGEERGVCREKTEGCWSKNRRAHFLVKAR